MASVSLGSSRLLVVVVMTIAVIVEASNQYIVGDEGGWRVPPDDTPDLYQTWASNIRFQVGDLIVFQYQNDSVVRVDKRGYYHCNETGAAAPGSSFRDGNTVFLLERPGFYYFVGGDLEHCKKGQRLMVEVTGPPPSAGGPSPYMLPNAATASSCSVPSRLLVLVVAVVVAAFGLLPGFIPPSTLF